MRHLRLLRGSTEVAPKPSLAAKCLQKDALASQPLREHGGQKSTGNRRLFQLRSLAGERCQHRLVARSQRLKGSVGPNLSGKSGTLGMIALPGYKHQCWNCSEQTKTLSRASRGCAIPEVYRPTWKSARQPWSTQMPRRS